MNITDVDDKIIRKTNDANKVSDSTEIANTTWRDLKVSAMKADYKE